MVAVRIIGFPAPYVEAIQQRLVDRELPQALQDLLPDVVLVLCDSDQRWAELVSEVEACYLVVAVLPAPLLDDYVRALALGASGVVPVDTSSLITATVVEAATHGEVLLPGQAAKAMALLAQRTKPPTDLDQAETELLRSIAGGTTIVELARQQFFSERTVRRHLQSLYLKLGVRNRAEAIAAASRIGLLD